jgi:hypothetical protein
MRLQIAVSALLLAGCSAVPHRDLERLTTSLRLEADFPSSIQPGQVFAVPYRLVNTSSRKLEFCLSQNKGLQVVDSTGRAGGDITVVDHPGCESRLALAPGEHVEGQQSIVVPTELRSGVGIVKVHVGVVSLRKCSPQYGCYEVSVSDFTRDVPIGESTGGSPPNNSLQRTNGLRPLAAELTIR